MDTDPLLDIPVFSCTVADRMKPESVSGLPAKNAHQPH